MWKHLIITTVFVFGYFLSGAQELPGLSYCLLFDSRLEKEAFQTTDDDQYDPLMFLLAYNAEIDSVKYENIKAELLNYSKKLLTKKKRSSNDLKFLKYVFKNVHQQYLKDYKIDETFSGIFDNRSYNCVSGVALYACVLDLLGYEPIMYETRYHIFLVIKQGTTNVLFETTDPIRGFIPGDAAVSAYITTHLKEERERVSKDKTLSAPFNTDEILEAVNLKELAGLHYYNIGLYLINEQNYFDAFRALKKASILYPRSERIADFLRFSSSKYDWQLSSVFETK